MKPASFEPSARKLLSQIDSPADLKRLQEDELPLLAHEIRDELISVLSQTGGHLGPNLGVVELTIALHRVFDTPADKVLFDVSHQGYVHKLLTGRRERFSTIRQYQGLNGFLLRTESEHDCYGAGHAGTALSAGLGMAVARDRRGSKENVVVVAGDAAFTCGISYEALNNVADHTKRFIVVLNDNEWSIAKNVGAIANYFNRIQTSDAYSHLHDKAGKFVEMIGGRFVQQLAAKVEEGVKHLLLPSVIFEELGLRYYGPIDGHDIPLLTRTFEFLKRQQEPVLLHIITQKGRGYAPAIEKPDKFHGLGKFKKDSGETAKGSTPTYSELLGQTLAKFADNNKKIAAITAAMPSGTGLAHFAAKHPDQYFDVGIAEEHAALFACGMAAEGFKPFLTIYSTFMQRAYDMVIHDIALQNLNVAICMDRAGLSGDDGPTHHGLFDIGYLRHVPNIVHMQPKDEEEFADMLWTMANYHQGPIAIRYPRGAGTGAVPKAQPKLLEIGKAEVVQHGQEVALLGLGNMFSLAEEVAKQLEADGVSVALINPRWIKPLDTGTIEFFARRVDVMCTFEDHVLHNGFGCAVIEHLSESQIRTPVVRIGWPDQFVEHGSINILREKHGITAAAALEKIRPFLKKKLGTKQPRPAA
ncbi:MAG TPA: 1-deoxy-D-xylulose-5-phosphate synthase [Chthoniobacterales bacterium]|jgi:1-deoxy-D-xylulose-5-phosphate synthase|nr:1-deoxy-D-xylulose-5-phosphate synthase [Chthoniobacterales bacterium]